MLKPIHLDMSANCPNCAKGGGIYDMKCPNCRHRIVMDEPCKLMRKQIVDSIKRYGDLAEWRIEPHCGCKGECNRLRNMRMAKCND